MTPHQAPPKPQTLPNNCRQSTTREDNAPADELANLAVDADEAVDELGRATAAGRPPGREAAVGLLARRMQIEGRWVGPGGG